MASALDYAALRPYFEALAVDDERTRLDASCAILAGLERASADTCRSVLERLIKGLASGRKSARIGFSVTLTEVSPLDPLSFAPDSIVQGSSSLVCSGLRIPIRTMPA